MKFVDSFVSLRREPKLREWHFLSFTLFAISMARPASSHPTASEYAILQVLWNRGPMTVRDVHEVVSVDSCVSYTTTLKTMQIMHNKGLVKRNTSQRSHIYSAAVSQQSTQGQLLKKVLNMAFGGSISRLVQGAIQSKAASKEELKEIQRLIEEHES
jgi:predicted transcriptional regulator